MSAVKAARAYLDAVEAVKAIEAQLQEAQERLRSAELGVRELVATVEFDAFPVAIKTKENATCCVVIDYDDDDIKVGIADYLADCIEYAAENGGDDEG